MNPLAQQARLYLDTSVLSFLSADDAPEKQAITQAFFEEVKVGKFAIFISALVLTELEAAQDETKRQSFLDTVGTYRPGMLDINEDVISLSQGYVKAGTLSERHLRDAQHIAVATVHDMDMLLSWNMRHIVRVHTREQVNAVNRLMGYGELILATPEEVISYED